MEVVNLLLIIALLGVVVWLICMIPMPAIFGTIIQIVALLIVICWVLTVIFKIHTPIPAPPVLFH